MCINTHTYILYACMLYMYTNVCIYKYVEIYILKLSSGRNSCVPIKESYSLSKMRTIAGKWLFCQGPSTLLSGEMKRSFLDNGM